MDLLKTLSELPGAPGREERVRDFIIEQVKDHVDHMETDALGNLICRIKGTSKEPKRVMVACHMDEIAFIVSRIDSKGFLRVNKLGGFDTRNLFARRVRIQTRKKGDVFGVFNPAGRPIHVASAEEREDSRGQRLLRGRGDDQGASSGDLPTGRPRDPRAGLHAHG